MSSLAYTEKAIEDKDNVLTTMIKNMFELGCKTI